MAWRPHVLSTTTVTLRDVSGMSTASSPHPSPLRGGGSERIPLSPPGRGRAEEGGARHPTTSLCQHLAQPCRAVIE